MAWSTLARLVRDGVALRVAHGVYRLRGNTFHENIDLCAAWLQLAPDIMAPHRITGEGVACRWSAASICGLAPAVGVHQFSLPVRRQTRRVDVKLYRADLAADEVVRTGGLLVTAPGRIVADLLGDGEDLVAVADVATAALGGAKTTRAGLAVAVAPYAAGFGFADYDGLSLVDWLIDLSARPHEFGLLQGRGSAPGEPTTADQQILLIRAEEVPAARSGGVTIRMTAVARQSNQRLPGPRGKVRPGA
jgi:hypothetical protein